jgi:hypothetical protein
MQQDVPTSHVPTYLKARVAGGHAVPGVELVSLESEEQAGAGGKRQATWEVEYDSDEEVGEEERHAMLEYVVKRLNEELVTELLEGFHSEK